MIRRFCFSSSDYFKKHGFGNPVVPKEGLFCAALNRQNKEFCRTRVESVSSPEKVRVLHYILFKCGHIVHCTYVVPKILSITFVYLTTECLRLAIWQVPCARKCLWVLVFGAVLWFYLICKSKFQKKKICHHKIIYKFTIYSPMEKPQESWPFFHFIFVVKVLIWSMVPFTRIY